MDRLVSISGIVIIAFFVFAGSIFGAEGKTNEKSQKEKNSVTINRELTNQEIALCIEDMLNTHEELTNFIVGLKKEFKEGGSPYYTYKGVKLQILDKEVLKKILGKIQSEVARINADRISKQIESIQQAQRTIAATQQAARASAVTVRSPVLPPNPPQTPRAPTTQPYVPRTPPPPPVPQRR